MTRKLDDRELENITGGADGPVFQPTDPGGQVPPGSSGGTLIQPGTEPIGPNLPPVAGSVGNETIGESDGGSGVFGEG